MVVDGHHKTLGDYFTLQRGTTYKSRLLGMPGPVLLGLSTIQRNGGFRTDSLQTYGGESPVKLMVRPGELYLSLKDVTQSADLLGAVARLPIDQSPGRLTQDTVKLEPKTTDVALDYLYWLLRTPQYRSYCRAHATGTTNLGLARDDFLAFRVPDLSPARQLIVDALGALDDKIELNRRMNETLEQMASALFKSWFADFDPVRAKADGRRPAGLDAETAALFPDSFVDSPLGEVPAGWAVSTIGEAVRVVGGSTPSTGEPAYWDNGTFAWATPKDLAALSNPVLLGTERRVTDLGLHQISSGLLPHGTVLLSSRAPIGYLAIAETPVAINQGFIAMICDGPLPNHYVLQWAETNMDVIKSRANGTTFQEVSKTNFRPLPILVPPVALLQRFVEQADVLHQRLVSNLRESQALAAMRDALLPRLLSGDIRVA